ncbi:MAG: phosphorylcholine transferase LicD [Erysipelotrichaceae bacterium]
MKMVDKNEHLQQLQAVELQMLKDFDKFCSENDIHYCLTYGTLIGAVRHQGFIPWDDDIDVFVKADDYLKLESIFNEKQTDGKYFLQTTNTDAYNWNLWGCVRLNNTSYRIGDWDYSRINSGIFIDIFPLADFPTEKKEVRKVVFWHRISNILAKDNVIGKHDFSYGTAGKIISALSKLIPEKTRIRLLQNYMHKILTYKSDSGYCFSTIRTTAVFPKEWFEETVLLDFEDGKFPCPKQYDPFLRNVYGDYMQLPPENERAGHGKVAVCFDTTQQD